MTTTLEATGLLAPATGQALHLLRSTDAASAVQGAGLLALAKAVQWQRAVQVLLETDKVLLPAVFLCFLRVWVVLLPLLVVALVVHSFFQVYGYGYVFDQWMLVVSSCGGLGMSFNSTLLGIDEFIGFLDQQIFLFIFCIFTYCTCTWWQECNWFCKAPSNHSSSQNHPKTLLLQAMISKTGPRKQPPKSL